MKHYVMRKVDFQHADVRGCLTQLVHEGWAQINVLESKKGATRGAHFHKTSHEAFYVISGSVDVKFIANDGEENVTFKKGDFFEIYPDVLHNMYFPEDCLMVQMYDKPVENPNGTKDIFTEDEF